MNRSKIYAMSLCIAMSAVTPFGLVSVANAATSEDLDHSSQQALQNLYSTHPTAEALAHKAKAILIFPNIVKAGLVFGGSFGEG
jgi:lipid-binding SYLF domain-containing protein